MRKYITLDFDEKGNPVMGSAKDRPAGGFVPTMWIPGGSDEPVDFLSGIKSLTAEVSFVGETHIPTSWDELIDAGFTPQGIEIKVPLYVRAEELGTTKQLTVVPTSDWYAWSGDGMGEMGEPVTYSMMFINGTSIVTVLDDPSNPTKVITYTVNNAI